MEGFRVSYTKQFFALFGPISLWTFWPNHNMSASQLPSVWCDDPTARAKMQHLRAMICKANSTTLTFLLLFQLLVQVWDSYLRGPLKQKITYADMLHRSVNGYVEKWHANTTAEHKKNKQKKKTKQKMDAAKIHLRQTWWTRESRGRCWWNILTTNFLSFKQHKLEKYIAPQKRENST